MGTQNGKSCEHITDFFSKTYAGAFLPTQTLLKSSF